MGGGPASGLFQLDGWLEPDAYSTAWVALVPDVTETCRPAWPEALDYLRTHQLDDGGWGEAQIYYAHERTISTMAAVKALSLWQSSGDDIPRIRRGLEALRRYANDLLCEPHEPVGFELLLPRLRDELASFCQGELPLEKWAHIDALSEKKLALIQHLQPNPVQQATWWFSMEMLPADKLATFDDSILDSQGSVATSTAATAAYLRARRLAGRDSPRASSYLSHTVQRGSGGVPFSCPVEVFERVWALDSLRRAGIDPRTPPIPELMQSIRTSWDRNEPGLSSSDLFRVNDGDDTAVGFTILNWAGLTPSDEPMLAFWDENHFRSYLDERTASVSANIHALTALRSQTGFPHKNLALRLTDWLIAQIQPETVFDDKWHISPYYLVARAIPAFAHWRDEIALQCISFLIEQQRSDGGWGWYGQTTLEETAHCVIGLCYALKWGLLEERTPLAQAAQFFATNEESTPREALYVGKTLFRSDGITKIMLFAAKSALVEQLSSDNRLSGSYHQPVGEMAARIGRSESYAHLMI